MAAGGPQQAGEQAPAAWRLLVQRLAAQLLSGTPGRSVLDVVRHLCALQAQDPRGARLAVRARSAGLTADDIDRALTEERSIMIGTLNRGTLHLVATEDYWWLHALTSPALFTGNARRLAQEGVPPADAERGVQAVRRSLESDGPLTRAQLRDRVAAAGVRTEGQALVHILWLASLQGLVVRGPLAGAEQAYVLARDWLPPAPASFDADAALAELARRYLAARGPAGDRDLAKWAGIGLGEARRGLAAIAPSLADRDDGLASLAAGAAEQPHAGGPPAGESLPGPRLLGAFDEVLMSWASRELVMDGWDATVVSGGLFRPFVLVDGRAGGTWRIASGSVAVSAFVPLTPRACAALADEAADVERFLAGRWLARRAEPRVGDAPIAESRSAPSG